MDATKSSATQLPDPEKELLAAAATAMRWLQDRQRHTPQELLDPRETRVLRRLREAVRAAS